MEMDLLTFSILMIIAIGLSVVNGIVFKLSKSTTLFLMVLNCILIVVAYQIVA